MAQEIIKEIKKTENDLLSLKIAFIQGAKWWEYKSNGFTIWGSDLELAGIEAQKRIDNGTLGKINNFRSK